MFFQYCPSRIRNLRSYNACEPAIDLLESLLRRCARLKDPVLAGDILVRFPLHPTFSTGFSLNSCPNSPNCTFRTPARYKDHYPFSDFHNLVWSLLNLITPKLSIAQTSLRESTIKEVGQSLVGCSADPQAHADQGIRGFLGDPHTQ